MGFRPQSRSNFRSEIPLSQSSPTTKHIFEHPQGRKPMLICCVTVFGVFSLLSALVGSPSQLACLRLLTGLGLGGGIPLAIALVSDFAPPAAQGRLVILMSAGIPIGFTLGGLLASQLVPVFGWPAIFVVGGILPLAMVPPLALWLPESVALSAATRPRNLVAALFRDGHAPSTALLWAMNLLNLVSNFLILLWTSAILHGSGESPSQAIFATSMYGLGIILGALLTASVADRLGVERVLTYIVAFGALCMLSLGLLDPRSWFLSVIICGAGVGIGGCQAGLNSLSGRIYPSTIRSTGAGWALGLGRVRRHCWAAPGRRAVGARLSGAGHLRRGRDSATRHNCADGDPRAIAAQLVRLAAAVNRLWRNGAGLTSSKIALQQ
jgi:AAHS family 4-hydroxybenzoate transporter-like MFS transporter